MEMSSLQLELHILTWKNYLGFNLFRPKNCNCHYNCDDHISISISIPAVQINFFSYPIYMNINWQLKPATVVECQLILPILDRHSMDTRSTSRSNLGRESTNFWSTHMSRSTLGWLPTCCWSSANLVLHEYQSRCWLSKGQTALAENLLNSPSVSLQHVDSQTGHRKGWRYSALQNLVQLW